MSKTNHQSHVDAEKQYTSYKWLLNDWSLLYDHYYLHSIESPTFVLSNTEGCLCQLIFQPGEPKLRDYENYGNVKILFHDEIDVFTMQAAVSFVDNEMNKKLTIKSVYGKEFPKPIVLVFNMVFNKTSVDKYLVNDTLILLFELTVVKSIKNPSLETERFVQSFIPSMHKNLEEIRKDKSFCDITFSVGDEQFSAHKIILAACSEVFRAMFTSGMKEQDEHSVDIVDIDATVFAAFIDYIYTRKVKNLETVVDGLVIVAEKYQIYDLKDLCENFMSANLDSANVIPYLIISHKLSCGVLKAKALKFVKINTNVLANVADLKVLSDYPELIEELFRK